VGLDPLRVAGSVAPARASAPGPSGDGGNLIIFVRHGQTSVNREGRFQGRLDPPLTELGQEQARGCASGLATSGATEVWTSPLQRAADTAREIATALAAPLEIDERLVELDYGEWDGRRFGEVDAAEWAAWRADPSFAPPGGESLASVGARVAAFCTERLRSDATIVAVSHVSPIKAAVAWALGVGNEATWHMQLDVASVTRIGRRANGPAYLAGYNDIAHLL
jgi:broad specificity phosphatase PhoE